MSIREATAALDLPSAEGSNRSCPLPETRRRAKPNRRSLNEREQSRAAAAETRVQELLNDVRRLRAALRKAESKPKPPPGDAGCLQTALKRSQVLTDTVKSLRAEMAGLRTENRRLREDLRVAANRKGTIEYQSRRIELLHELLGTYRNQKDDVRVLSRQVDVLSEDVGFLRPALKTSEKERKALASRVRVIEPRLASLSTQLRGALTRSRRQKAAIKSLSRENARLRKAVQASQTRIETLETLVAKLRATGSALSKTLFGRKSEQQEKQGSGRKRGQQRGAPGHGRTQRPGLEEKTERRNPPKDARVCSCCGKPYTPNGARSSTIVEIHVKAHKRVINRPRWRRGCECASSPLEVTAPPVPRLFPRTPYGNSVWARFLFERYDCLRPLNQVAEWMGDQGLPISPGTLAGSVSGFLPVFEPLGDAILAHQNKETLRHGDETTWRVQALREKARSTRSWLWTSVCADAVYFHIDPSRSAEAAEKLFGDAAPYTVIVCDRYSGYKKLARTHPGKVILAYCWSHQRRDFIKCAAGQENLTDWCETWIERVAEIYRLNDARLEHYDPGSKHQTPAFDAAQAKLKEALDRLFVLAEEELAGLPARARQGKALRSLLNHREGLCVFLHNPQVPMDNNFAERILRGPAIGRRLSFGSDSEDGARFTALMYSVIGTLSMNGIDVLRWLEAWLKACAKNGGKPPDNLSPWLPWTMSEKRKRKFMAPG